MTPATLPDATRVRLDIFSDPVCPWCMIGKANLDRALESRPDHPFAVEWHPFQLNPDMPKEGTDRRAYLEAKFGGRDRAVQIYARVAQAAEAAGVPIDFERMERTPNTLDAHRLIHWAGLEGRQTAIAAALFRAYFREGRDIGDAATLAAIAGEAGMDATVVTRLLASDADADDIAARDADARRRGVSAVPTFLIARQYVVSGAQPVAFWQQVIDELAAQANPPT
ncbi:MAG: DsbA family oxidoreductase [Paracoccaceae bacterium]|nr:MAG: DsbA family oxidoreductase [Paracoccaceae bacterium]